MDFLQIILTPFSWLLKTFCDVFGNYGVALIFFALVIKVILFPLSLKGKKSMIQMNLVSGEMQALQKRCGNDRQKYNEEVQKLYSERGVNPMSGCLWSMLPMPILIALYAIIRRPFRYIMHLADDKIIAIADALNYAAVTGKEFLTNGKINGYSEMYLAGIMNKGNVATATAAAGGAALYVINFNFLGLDLSQIPTWKFWEGGITWASFGLFLLPVLSAGASVLSTYIMNKTNAMNQQQAQTGAAANKSMLVMMPIMSLWIGFVAPAGLSIYWIANSVLGVAQEIICGKMLKKDYEEAQLKMEQQALKAKEEEKNRRRESAERKAAAIEAAKKNGGKSKGNGKPQPQSKVKGVDLTASREGIRAYARGRAYDPSRYPVTEYRDPNGPEKIPASEAEPEPLTDEEKALLTENAAQMADEVSRPVAPEFPAAPSAGAPAEEPENPGDYEAEAAPESEDAAPADDETKE